MAKDIVKKQGMEMSCLPFLAEGRVVKGFGRGSKQLGIPTANFTQDVVDTMPTDMIEGVYYGLANVDGGLVSRMVMSVGHNPHFANPMRTMVRTHLLNLRLQRVWYISSSSGLGNAYPEVLRG